MDSKIIEIIGPPGVGKTTIYGSLCKTWNPVYSWIHQDALLTPKPTFSNFNNWTNYQFRKLFGKKSAKSIPVSYGLKFINNHPELANFFWDYLSDVYTEEIDKRFRLAYFLFSDFCRYQAILESESNKFCIINEGLLQKSIFVDDDDFITDMLHSYFSLMPLPYAVINIKIDNERVILERLQNRKKVIASHIGKDNDALLEDVKKWQRLLSSMVEIIMKRGVIVYDIDGEKPIKENVKFLRSKLQFK